MTPPKNIAILGASGYTGAELVRLIASHPLMKIKILTADRKAGMQYGEVFPHLRYLNLPELTKISDMNFSDIDLTFCALPHATSQAVIGRLRKSMKIVDLSADFRLRDPEVYAKWYGGEHTQPLLQKEAVYGLTEYYRDKIKNARLVAGTGCNAMTGLMPVLPLLAADVIDTNDIIIDLATGVSGAGRGAKEGMLHSEVSEGYRAYNVAAHRHLAEFDQEMSLVSGKPVQVTFTPHLLPQNRGILATVYVKGDVDVVYGVLKARYENEPFVYVLPQGLAPATQHVRGSNYCHIGVIADRKPGRVMIFSALDNLTKGSSGQAIQNANLMLGLPETMGLEMVPLFP